METCQSERQDLLPGKRGSSQSCFLRNLKSEGSFHLCSPNNLACHRHVAQGPQPRPGPVHCDITARELSKAPAHVSAASHSPRAPGCPSAKILAQGDQAPLAWPHLLPGSPSRALSDPARRLPARTFASRTAHSVLLRGIPSAWASCPETQSV